MSTYVDNFKLVFAGKASDTLAVIGLKWLEKLGNEVVILSEEEYAPVGSVVFYTVTDWKWTSKNIRVAAHRIYPNRPNWAVTTPFVVEIKSNPKGNIENAFETLALEYKRWFRGGTGTQVPWESVNGRTTSYTNELENWFDIAADTVGADKLAHILETQANVDKIRGRGGEIVLHRLADTGRVVINREDVLNAQRTSKNFGQNAVYNKIAGYTTPVVSYGTSDAANMFELLQAVKLGVHLGLPVVFETYPSAHNWEYWTEGFLAPSLLVLGQVPQGSDTPANGYFGLKGTSKYSTHISSETVRTEFPKLGLSNIAEIATPWADAPIWQFYQSAMRQVVDEMLGYLNVSAPYTLTTFERIASETGLDMRLVKPYARDVEAKAGHNVVMLNSPKGRQLMTSELLPSKSIGELHAEGFWLGGAPLYDTVFSLGEYGGIVVMVKDSTAGRVNLMAKHYMGENSGLYLAPAGLFRLTADGQNEDWSIDPLVMLELMRRWGPEQTQFEVRKIWSAMEVPLDIKHIGRKTVCTVTLGGIQTRVVDI